MVGKIAFIQFHSSSEYMRKSSPGQPRRTGVSAADTLKMEMASEGHRDLYVKQDTVGWSQVENVPLSQGDARSAARGLETVAFGGAERPAGGPK